MSPVEVIAVTAIVFGVTTVTRVTAFGAALLTVPLLSLLLDAKTAVVSSIMLSLVNSAVLVRLLRRVDDGGTWRRIGVGVVVGLVPGALVLDWVSARVLTVLIAVVVLASVVALVGQRRVAGPSSRLDVAVGVVVGVLTTSVSTNGPPMVLLLQARQVPPEVFRATLTRVFLIANVFGLAVSAATGQVTGRVAVTVAAALPGLLAGQFAGLWLAPRVPPQRFRQLVLVLLVATAVAAGLSALR